MQTLIQIEEPKPKPNWIYKYPGEFYIFWTEKLKPNWNQIADRIGNQVYIPINTNWNLSNKNYIPININYI